MAVGIQSKRFRPALEKLTAEWEKQPSIVIADVSEESEIDMAFDSIANTNDGKLHALLHAIAYAPASALQAPVLECSKADFLITQERSSFSLIALAKRAVPLLEAAGGGSITALSFAGSTRVAPGYGIMGPAKASLESVARALAVELVSMS